MLRVVLRRKLQLFMLMLAALQIVPDQPCEAIYVV